MSFFKKSQNKLRFIMLFGLMILSSCATTPDLNPETTSPEELYNRALDFLVRDKEFTKAIKGFDEIDRYYPYSRWALRSQVMLAFSYYIKREYDDCLIVLDRFIQLYPASTLTPYAYYLKALAYYAQLSDTSRDQKMTEHTLNALQEVIDRYPESPYAQDARQKVLLAQDYLASKEINIGLFYLNQNKHIAAMNRFGYAVREFQTTGHVQEALYRLVETYLILGLDEEAQKSAAILGYNYPESLWYKRAYALMKKYMPSSIAPTQKR